MTSLIPFRLTLLMIVASTILFIGAHSAVIAQSSDGFGYSAPVNVTLGNGAVDISMLQYPSGFTGDSSFWGGVFDGQSIWLVPYGAISVMTIDKDTGVMTAYNSWPAGFTKTTTQTFVSGVYDGQGYVWLVPYDASTVIKIDKVTKVMTGYNSWPAGFTKNIRAFMGATFDGQNIWFAPYNADRVIKIDKDTGTMTGYNTWPAGFTMFNANSFSSAVRNGPSIWLIPRTADRVIKMDMSSGAMTGYNSWPAGFTKGSNAFMGAIHDGQSIWMVPYSATHLIKIDMTTELMTGYNSWPVFRVNSAFAGGMCDGQSIWLVPNSATHVLKVDIATGVMTAYTNWPASFTKSSSTPFFGGVFDGSKFYLVPGQGDVSVISGPWSVNAVTPTPASVAPTPASIAPAPASIAPTPASIAPAPASIAPTPASVAPTASTMTPACEFMCRSGLGCASLFSVCDGVSDCSDGSDEAQCFDWYEVERNVTLALPEVFRSVRRTGNQVIMVINGTNTTITTRSTDFSVSSAGDCRAVAMTNGSQAFAFSEQTGTCVVYQHTHNVSGPFNFTKNLAPSSSDFIVRTTLSSPLQYLACSRSLTCSGNGQSSKLTTTGDCACICDPLYTGRTCRDFRSVSVDYSAIYLTFSQNSSMNATLLTTVLKATFLCVWGTVCSPFSAVTPTGR